jgi:hypothetical protein
MGNCRVSRDIACGSQKFIEIGKAESGNVELVRACREIFDPVMTAIG